MDLDIRTLSFVATLSNFLMFMALVTLWRVNRQEKATFHWMIGALLMAVGFFLIGLRHQIPQLISVVVANLSILAGFYTHCVGVYAFLKKRMNRAFSWGLFALVGAGFGYFTYVDPDVAIRIVLISWSVSLLTLLAAQALIKEYKRAHSLPVIFLSSVFATFSALMAARGIFVLFEETISDFMASGAIHAVTMIIFIALSISLSIGYSVLVTVRLNQKLLQEIDVKNRFFSIIAHDLRSPFTVLNGYTSQFQILAETKSREELVGYAANINASATKVLRLVDNLLDWSYAQSTNETVVPKANVMREVVDLALGPLLQAAEAKQLNVDVQAGDERAFADPNMLGTVVRNLLDNAIKFSRPGDEITVMSRAVGSRIEIVVRDTGGGISPDVRTSLFDVGTKTTTVGTAGEKGSGLGLPLCRDLLRKNRGDIVLDDSWTKGARFVVTLPAGAP